jgi:hypothetical protein
MQGLTGYKRGRLLKSTVLASQTDNSKNKLLELYQINLAMKYVSVHHEIMSMCNYNKKAIMLVNLAIDFWISEYPWEFDKRVDVLGDRYGVLDMLPQSFVPGK